MSIRRHSAKHTGSIFAAFPDHFLSLFSERMKEDPKVVWRTNETMEQGKSRSLAITVYSPDSAMLRPGVMAKGMINDLKASRELAWRLALRDLRSLYRQSFLGFLWAFISPLSNTVAWIFLSASGVVRVADTAIPYPAYVFTGTMLWQLLVESIQNPLQQTMLAKPMLSKLNFPREAVILSGAIKMASSAGIKLLILIPAVFMLGVVPDWHLALVPVALLVIMMTGIGLGLILAPVGMLYTDIGRVIPLIAQFAMYLSPVVFAMPQSGRLLQLFQYNPATPLILTGRAWLTGSGSPMLGYFLLVSTISMVLLILGWVLYRITMPVLIERMSA